MKFVYTDGEDICLYDDGKITKQEGGFFRSYRSNLESIRRSKEWKQSGDGAKFRGDDERFEDEEAQGVLSGVCMAGGEKVAYSFTAGDTSGVYTKDFSVKKDNEAHVVNSAESVFSGIFCDSKNGVLACSVQNGSHNADIALINLDGYDYKSVTCGDTMDEYPFISPDDCNKIYFSSRGVARSGDGEFCGYSPSYICMLDLDKMEVTSVKEDKNFSYFRPVYYNGEVYSIKAPAKQKRGNPVIEILLIPFRLLQALVNFIHFFIIAFTGKSVVSGGTGGDNPAKKRKQDGRKIFIDGNLVNVDKEYKRNSRKKDKDFGFIPLSWKLINGADEVLFSGAADYDIDGGGNIIVTNGKHIFALNGGKKQKLCDCGYCVNVACLHTSDTKTAVFDF
ncbi:MAG: hypothetical protein LUD27_01385 [Clostridia bacterium]|nr:hypothetical protein [Clostridia bacterium]